MRNDFSVATRAKADVLPIDEALAVGDAASQTTIVFVTHDMGAVRQFCDHAMLDDECSIAAQGSPENGLKPNRCSAWSGPSMPEAGA